MDIIQLLEQAREMKASDLHVTAGLPPMGRINGAIMPLDRSGRPLSPREAEEMLFAVVPPEYKDTLLELGECDFAYELPHYGRYRVNVYRESNSYAGAFRLLNDNIPSFTQLGLPAVMPQIAELKSGLVLVTGPTGSGKSTTLASVIDYINTHRKCHIITMEDPIEYKHEHKDSMVNQREVGRDTMSFANSLRAALREDPDVILVGEMRDLETISAAITAAETGHLVLSTLHTIGAATTINRIVDVFPENQQAQVRTQLATVIEAVITQRLVVNSTNSGRCAAFEVMLGTDAVRNMIRENKCYQISTILQTNQNAGMQSLDFDLARLVQIGRIRPETALHNCVDIEYLRKLIRV